MTMLLTKEPRKGSAGETSYMFLADPTDSERRRGLRLRQSRPVKVFEPISSRYIAGQTEDVSTTGLRVTLPASTYLRPGAILNVHVGVGVGGEPLANRRAMMPARVVWVDRSGDMNLGKMCAGVEFTASIAAHLDAA
jgi:hypothetical protein